MYSQYSYYQNNASQPQQQQPQPGAATTTSTSGQVWNGQQWVPSASSSAPASYAQAVTTTTAAPTPSSANAIIKHGKTHTQLVQHYTTYYHAWLAQTSSAKQALASLPPPHPNTPSNNAQREEMERREKWASYYASNSAALAHYHLGAEKSGGGVGVGGVRPPSPPAPPQMAVSVPVAVAVAAAPVAAPVAAVTTVAAPAAASPGRKKSRWAATTTAATGTTTTASENNYYGKSTTSSTSYSAPATGTEALEAAAIAQRSNLSKQSNQSGDSLYLSKFVQGKPLASVSQSSVQKSQPKVASSPARAAAGGTKRKMAERYDSSLSANDSYYGPGSGGAGGSVASSRDYNQEEEDYVPFALDKPLGSSTKLSKKQSKKQKKLLHKQQSSLESSGFDANQSILSSRANRFRGKGGLDSASATPSSVENVEKYMGKTVIGGTQVGGKGSKNNKLDEHDYERMTVKGSCTKLEKEYLRLTSPPKAELVRPQYILEKHLANLKKAYYVDGKVHCGRGRDYNWFCSQFKAIRQDLTVQRIANAFSVDVYETHAKVALEEDDINEYNQSQTQLKELYDVIERNGERDGSGGGGGGSGGGVNNKGLGVASKKIKKKGKNKSTGEEKSEEDGGALKNRNEFIAYRIIYYVFLSGNRKYEGGSSDIFKIMLQLTPEQRKDDCIHHALLVRAAVADNDYHKFFQLQDTAPNMGDYLMDKIVPSVRQSALQRICKAYRPSVSAEFVLRELGFDVQNREEAEGGKGWMEGCGCRFDGGLLMTKDTVLREGGGGVVKNSLI